LELNLEGSRVDLREKVALVDILAFLKETLRSWPSTRL